VPVAVEREERVAVVLRLFRDADVPAGFLPVGGTPHRVMPVTADPASFGNSVATRRESFFSRLPTTCADWADFLNDVARTDPARATALAPRSDEGEIWWPCDDARRWVVPTSEWLARAGTAAPRDRRRLTGASEDWRADWPALGLCWADAHAYAAWRSARDGFLYTLPDEFEWQAAARGADERVYPWGDRAHRSTCCNSGSWEEGSHPSPVGAFPRDESPWGVRDMGGNAMEPCLNESSPTAFRERALRGGDWCGNTVTPAVCARRLAPPELRGRNLGVRLVAAAALDHPEAECASARVWRRLREGAYVQ
jgi:serine/threonine-protein kinase